MKKLLSVLLATLIASASALAAWPDKTVTLVVPFPPGGGADALMRPLAPRFAEAGLSLEPVVRPRTHLALNPGDVEHFHSGAITVLRDGQHVATERAADTNQDRLIQQMVGREVKQYTSQHLQRPLGEELLRVENLSSPRKFREEL
mgnify:CR=1 FL=1